jgi:hypothetical protein
MKLNRLPHAWLPAAAIAWALPSAAQPAATNQLRPWTEYRTIMWISDSAYRKPEKAPLFFQRLRELGINTAMVYGDGNLRPVPESQFPYYVENIINRGLCLKFSSKVTDWDRFVTTWAKSGRPESAFLRDYPLDDPQWRAWARREMQRVVRKNAPHQPLAYDIRDELSTTVSANPFDYDFSPVTLVKFREWLQAEYPDLTALNAQWETKFARWDDVKPFTTDQIKARMAGGEAIPRGPPDWHALQRLKFDPVGARQQPTRWNFSPWCDFRTYMDISLARALDDLRQAAREVDPRTPVGIEGTQMPHAFGGYDLWRLAQALDWVEPYDIGNAREIFGSFMPGRPILTTVFEKDTNQARRRLWHLLLEGDRGCIVWWSEDCIDWQSDDCALTPKARALAPVLKEMTSPLAQLFLRAEKEFDPIAIHYSQPSVQVDWLLESTGDGSTWHRRFSSFEAQHNRMAKVRNSWLKALQDLGWSPVFVSSAEVLAGRLRRGAFRGMVLPQSLALSADEAERLRGFMFTQPKDGPGPVVLCDGTPGLFDEHGRLRLRSRLEDLFPPVNSARRSHANSPERKTVSRDGDIASYARQRLAAPPDFGWARWLADSLSPLATPVQVPLESRTRLHRFKLGAARLLAFERNVDYHMSEDLKQAGGNEALEKPVDLEARLAQPAHAYDLRAQKYLGHTDRLRFTLDPWQPSLFALLAEKIPAENIVAQLGSKSVR